MFISLQHASNLNVSGDEDKRSIQKFDFQLIPAHYLLCPVSFVKKIAIGNARIASLASALLDPKSNQFNVILSVFWTPYIIAKIPSNLLMKRVSPPACFSILAILSGSCKRNVRVSKNLFGNYKRPVGSAMVLDLGSVDSIITSSIFLNREAPIF